MKRKTTPIIKTVYEDIFVADDGKIFKGENAEAECLAYENEIKKAEHFISQIETAPLLGEYPFSNDRGYDDGFDTSFYKPASKEEVESLFRYYWVDIPEENYESFIGKWIAIDWRDGEGYVVTIDEITAEVARFYKELGYEIIVKEIK